MCYSLYQNEPYKQREIHMCIRTRLAAKWISLATWSGWQKPAAWHLKFGVWQMSKWAQFNTWRVARKATTPPKPKKKGRKTAVPVRTRSVWKTPLEVCVSVLVLFGAYLWFRTLIIAPQTDADIEAFNWSPYTLGGGLILLFIIVALIRMNKGMPSFRMIGGIPDRIKKLEWLWKIFHGRFLYIFYIFVPYFLIVHALFRNHLPGWHAWLWVDDRKLFWTIPSIICIAIWVFTFKKIVPGIFAVIMMIFLAVITVRSFDRSTMMQGHYSKMEQEKGVEAAHISKPLLMFTIRMSAWPGKWTRIELGGRENTDARIFPEGTIKVRATDTNGNIETADLGPIDPNHYIPTLYRTLTGYAEVLEIKASGVEPVKVCIRFYRR